MAKRSSRRSSYTQSGVGYGRPPAAHRFKPGQSGNPTGRAKGAKNLKTDLSDELSETITVQEAGRSASITKQRAFIKRLCAKALAGEPRAMAQLANLALRLIPQETGTGQEDDLSAADAALLERFLARSHGRPTAKANGTRGGRAHAKRKEQGDDA